MKFAFNYLLDGTYSVFYLRSSGVLEAYMYIYISLFACKYHLRKEKKIIKILVSVLIPIPFSPEQCQGRSVLGASRDALWLTKCLRLVGQLWN